MPAHEEAPGQATEGNSNSKCEGINLNSQDTGQQRHQDTGDSIYSRGAPLYRKAGWRAPLPFPPGRKDPPPTGYTGHDGRWPDEEQIDQWVQNRPRLSNLALRVDHGLVGIDVDAYDTKTGGWTLNEAESRWGPLPSTWRSTSRIDDDVSGIWVFQVPVGVFFRSKIQFKELGLGDIEIVQPHHRYVTAWPSIHPKTGQRYRWYAPHGTLLPEDQVPHVDDIPELPDAWVTGLAKNSVREEFFDGSAPNRPPEEDAVVDEEVYERLTHLTDNGAPDEVVDTRLQKALLELTHGAGSRYDATRDHVAALMRFDSWGRVGVPRALAELFTAYVAEVLDARPRAVAEAEFKRFTEGAALLIAADQGSDPWSTLGMDGPQTGANESPANEGDDGERARWDERMVPGGSFVLDAPVGVESLWGSDDRVIWADGEGLMVTGTQGVGKTTLAQQLVLALLGVVDRSILGLPVLPVGRRVLYLAMDRPHQIRRAFRRQCRDEHRHLLDENLVIWKGPPPADLAKHPEILTELAEQSDADVVVVDSLKDAAVGLSEDEVGSGWNRAAQGLLATGRNLLVLHHRKKQKTNARTGLDDVYGSTWLTSGMGSVVLLDGNPGDPLVEFRHLKSPVAEVGPMKVSHDQASGLMAVAEQVDLVAVAQAEGRITVKQAALLLFGSATTNDVEKARRRLDKRVVAGELVKKDEGGASAYHPVLAAFRSSGGNAS
jgi:Bifunctional DNA primase/polymerase, N-terminal/AAA domain